MRPTERLGKISKSLLEEVVLPRLGASRSEVLVGPRHGIDNSIIRIGDGKVIILATDPVSAIPALGLQESAWLSVHTLSSDITTSGFPPSYAALDFNLPPSMKDDDFKTYWEAMSREFERLGVAVVSGHTGRYNGCDYTVIGGGTLVAVGDEDKYVTSGMAKVGDEVILTKGAAIETTGVLSRAFHNIVAEKLGDSFLHRSQEMLRQSTTVVDAITAISVGVRDDGVTAMHDATEGGISGGLAELAASSGTGLRIRRESIPVSEEAEKICALFQLDPYNTLSGGTLILTTKPETTHEVVQALRSRGIKTETIGEVIPAEEGMYYFDGDEKKRLAAPATDPYWKSYQDALERGWT